MRLHRLEMTAFGPFADTTEVDFDQLSAAGVFLLTGATGAGKTSVLDAVCFALYGQVPGDRSGARHLRSDHAAPSLAPRVVLEVSIGDRSFRFSRSPAWSRPKQRGAGETRAPAHVVVEERRGGEWVALTNRLDDAGLLVADLLGMSATQFTQVALLPQGRFQAFLHASSAERHSVLQKLFRTDRFEQVERWLVERRTTARRASEATAVRVLEVLNRIQEAAGAELPAEWRDELAGAVESTAVSEWSAVLLREADEARARAQADRAAADDVLRTAEAAQTEARRVHDLQARAEAAARELVALRGRRDELAALDARLAAHRRAVPVAALLARADSCRHAAERATSRWEAARGRGEPLGPDDEATGDRLTALLHEAVAERAVAESFRPRALELAGARERVAAQRARAAGLREALSALDATLAEQPAAVAAARAAVDEAREAAARLPVLEHEVAAVEELVEAGRRRDAVVAELADARAALTETKAVALTARDVYLDAREARINGMAAELAGALAVGCACPVCGSATHPAPAHAGTGVVGRAEEEAARKAHEDAAFVQQTHEVRVATLTTELERLDARLAGVDRAGLPVRLRESGDAVGLARRLAAQLTDRTARLQAVDQQGETARDARERRAVELAALQQEIDAKSATVESLTAELGALLGDSAPDLEALIADRAVRCDRLERAVAAFTAYDEAVRAAAEADAALDEAAREAGFDRPQDVRAALLESDEVARAEKTLTGAHAARLAAEQALADPSVRAAVGLPAPDLDVAVVKQRIAADAAGAAASTVDAATARCDRLHALDLQLRARLDEWAPLREEHARVASLSQLVEGKGPDNPLRVRLAAYVLSERLRQVVAAANERLARMTAQRYSLEHTDDRGAGEQRGGLSLLVRDDWNGVARDPATLSGGETFVVSLALALGLADTVAHEAGGTDIDTLFIDEGFGSLDSDTLEDVMDTLDTLRDGGRVVGLVSHVPELRSRITTQLEVLKGRRGSTLRPVLVGG